MTPEVQLRRQQISDLALIRDIKPAELLAFATRIEQLSPPPLRPDALVDIACDMLPTNSAEAVVRQSLSIHALIRQGGLTTDDALNAVSNSLTKSSEWTEDELARWATVKPAVETLISSRRIRLVSSAIQLSYEYANLLSSARILTDIRPIYDEDARLIEGAVVSHTLRIKYDSADGDHALSIAMDETDVIELIKQCQRALTKAEAARNLMISKADVPTMISGESNNAK